MKALNPAGVIAFLAVVGLASPALSQQEMAAASGAEILAAQRVDRVTSSQDPLLSKVDDSDRVYTRLENTMLKAVSYFHRRKIGDAIVEKDFIRYQFNTETGELVEEAVHWREGLPDKVIPEVSQAQAESMVEGEVRSSQLYFISPESEIFHFKPTPKNPCWVVRSTEGERLIITVIDAVTGRKLGYGIPPPWDGFSLNGPDHPPNCDVNNCLWTAHATNAETWFESMGYDTQRIAAPTEGQVQAHIQTDNTVMFYELAHGGSTSFRNRCTGDDHISATEIETWIGNYASMGFAFIGSCEGLCNTGDNTFAHEFRKGLGQDSVVVGYCGMSGPNCVNDCWGDAIGWQTRLFQEMQGGWTVSTAFAQANLAFPGCTDQGHNCMRIAGDTNLRFDGNYPGTSDVVPKMRRSLSGSIYDIWIPFPGFYFSPLQPVKYFTSTRAHHIRTSSSVPAGQFLTISASSSRPYNEIVFLNNSKISVQGTHLSAATGTGTWIRFVSEADRGKGVELRSAGELKAHTGGEIKIHE